MLNRRLAVLTATLAVALTALTGTAQAALLSDLTALGYTVGLATQCETPSHAWLNVWYVSGFGMGTYLSECDPAFQANLDSIASPAGHCDRKWQFLQPQQVGPWSSIARLGWTTTADKCGDVFTVTNPNDGTVRYSGPGAGLAALAAVIGAPPVPPVPVAPPPVAPAPAPPAATQAPQTVPVVAVAVTAEPPPATSNESVATPQTITITLTPGQLQAMIDSAVAKALKKVRAKTQVRAQRQAPSSSHRKAQVRRR